MEPEQLKKLHNVLISWGKFHFRNFPWRNTKDPYKILIAEILLHRTRATQVVPLYEKFITRYPAIQDLSGAEFDEITTLLGPAGLKWRIDLIDEMIKKIVADFNGQIPENKMDLLSLPGVGNYIASAVRCFSWGYPEMLVDTNTVRICGRINGIKIDDKSRRERDFLRKMEEFLDKKNPAAFNYAMLDLGALICHTKNPECENCPLYEFCQFALKN